MIGLSVEVSTVISISHQMKTSALSSRRVMLDAQRYWCLCYRITRPDQWLSCWTLTCKDQAFSNLRTNFLRYALTFRQEFVGWSLHPLNCYVLDMWAQDLNLWAAGRWFFLRRCIYSVHPPFLPFPVGKRFLLEIFKHWLFGKQSQKWIQEMQGLTN